MNAENIILRSTRSNRTLTTSKNPQWYRSLEIARTTHFIRIFLTHFLRSTLTPASIKKYLTFALIFLHLYRHLRQLLSSVVFLDGSRFFCFGQKVRKECVEDRLVIVGFYCVISSYLLSFDLIFHIRLGIEYFEWVFHFVKLKQLLYEL